MSLGSTKLNVVPSRAVRVQIKTRIELANKGYTLLKHKLDGITYKHNVLEEEIKTCRIQMTDKLKLAYLALNKLAFLGFDFRSIFCSKPDSNPQIILKSTIEHVAGVTIRGISVSKLSTNAFPLAGLDRAGEQVQIVRKVFFEALEEIVEVASRNFMVTELKQQMRSINTRCNAIEYVVIPRLKRTLAYIDSELDEIEREEFFRIKRAKASRMAKKEKKDNEEKEQEKQEDQPTQQNLSKNDESHEEEQQKEPS